MITDRALILLGAMVLMIVAIVVPTAIVVSGNNKSENSSGTEEGLAPGETVAPSFMMEPTMAPPAAPVSTSTSSWPTFSPTATFTQVAVPSSPSDSLTDTLPTLFPTDNDPIPTTTGVPTSSPLNDAETFTPTESLLDPSEMPVTSLPTDVMLLAYYYPWYIKDDWSRHGYVDTPELGLYGTDDPAVAEQHIGWANQAGIDSFVVSWNGRNSLTTRHIPQGLLKANNIDTIKFAMLYETFGALTTTRDFGNGTLALDTVVADMQLFANEYFSHPSYLRINGRPVVVIYVTRIWGNFTPSMLDVMRDAVEGEDIFFIADEPFFWFQRSPQTAMNGFRPDGVPIFEAYTTYNMFEDARVVANESATDFMMREGLPVFEQWSRETVFYPNVLPMYHDFRGHKPLVGTKEGLKQQLETYYCLAKPEWRSATGLPNMMFVTTFNEWWEGSQIEPDTGRYGTRYIEALREFKDSGLTCS